MVFGPFSGLFDLFSISRQGLIFEGLRTHFDGLQTISTLLDRVLKGVV